MPVKKLPIYFFAFGLLLFGAPARAQLTMPSTTNNGLESQVRTYFADAPEMIAIAKCESGFRQFNNSGVPLAGGFAGNYIGVFQISRGHASDASAMGMDIYTTEGNLAYARYLYQKQGTFPWSGCLSVPAAVPPVVTASPPLAGGITPPKLTLNLKMGMAGPEIITLQQLLNAAGFTVAVSGPGSPGNETNKFGALTRQALLRFQCKKNIACSGNETSTGFGQAGPVTRAALLAPL
jgi:Putative peptidoglycan binding domain